MEKSHAAGPIFCYSRKQEKQDMRELDNYNLIQELAYLLTFTSQERKMKGIDIKFEGLCLAKIFCLAGMGLLILTNLKKYVIIII